MYQKYGKRILDIVCALLALIVFCWLYVLIAILVRIKLGSPVFFKQPRPGMKNKNGIEKIFCLYKFRTMTDASDDDGNLLPDNLRLTHFGKILRDWSLDELPEAINILKGDMSVVGPRPQLVRDMVFMTENQRRRHDVRPGLTGLAQISGRNAISWEVKLQKDLEYVSEINFFDDVWIVLKTISKVFKHDGISAEGMVTVADYGEELMKIGTISVVENEKKQDEAKDILLKAGF